MSQPDIIVPLTEDPNGPKAWVWIEAVEITRQGSTATTGIPQLEDKWHINLPLRASLALPDGSDVQRDANGNEITVPVPASVRFNGVDLAKLLHDAAVQTLAVSLRDVSLRLVNRDLLPQP